MKKTIYVICKKVKGEVFIVTERDDESQAKTLIVNLNKQPKSHHSEIYYYDTVTLSTSNKNILLSSVEDQLSYAQTMNDLYLKFLLKAKLEGQFLYFIEEEEHLSSKEKQLLHNQLYEGE